MNVNIEYLRTDKTPCYGGFNIETVYEINTVTNGKRNRYTVFCRLAGLEGGQIWNDPTRYEAHDNNEETLIESAIFEIFEDNIC